MAVPTALRSKVFVGCSHRDAAWVERVRAHLVAADALELDVWHDRRRAPGQQWEAEIAEALAASKVALLLVTTDFIESTFVEANELPPLLDAAAAQGAVVMPLIVGASRFQDIPALHRHRPHNDPGRPLAALDDAESEQVLATLSHEIARLVAGREAPLGNAGDDDDDDYHEGPAGEFESALAADMAVLLEDEAVDSLEVFAADGDDEVDLLAVVMLEDGQVGVELVPDAELPPHLRLTPQARRYLVDELGFSESGQPDDPMWIECGPAELAHPGELVDTVLDVLGNAFEVDDEEIGWRLVET